MMMMMTTYMISILLIPPSIGGAIHPQKSQLEQELNIITRSGCGTDTGSFCIKLSFPITTVDGGGSLVDG